MNTDTLFLFKKPLDCLPSFHWSCSTLVTTTKNRSVSVTSKLLNDLQHWMVSAHRLKLAFICTKGTKTPVRCIADFRPFQEFQGSQKPQLKNVPNGRALGFPNAGDRGGLGGGRPTPNHPKKNPPQAAISAAVSQLHVKSASQNCLLMLFSTFDVFFQLHLLMIFSTFLFCTVTVPFCKLLLERFYETLVSNIEDKTFSTILPNPSSHYLSSTFVCNISHKTQPHFSLQHFIPISKTLLGHFLPTDTSNFFARLLSKSPLEHVSSSSFLTTFLLFCNISATICTIFLFWKLPTSLLNSQQQTSALRGEKKLTSSSCSSKRLLSQRYRLVLPRVCVQPFPNEQYTRHIHLQYPE